MTRHLTRLAAVQRGGTRLLVMQSNGRRGRARGARRGADAHGALRAAGGVVGAVGIARRAGVRRVLTLDMGGTSTDVALVDGDVPRRSEWELDGMAVRLPVVDIHTVGAGGGSLPESTLAACSASARKAPGRIRARRATAAAPVRP